MNKKFETQISDKNSFANRIIGEKKNSIQERENYTLFKI